MLCYAEVQDPFDFCLKFESRWQTLESLYWNSWQVLFLKMNNGPARILVSLHLFLFSWRICDIRDGYYIAGADGLMCSFPLSTLTLDPYFLADLFRCRGYVCSSTSPRLCCFGGSRWFPTDGPISICVFSGREV